MQHFLNTFFEFSCWQPLGVNAITDLVAVRSLFGSFITIYPWLSLSKDFFLNFSFWELLGCSCSRGQGPAVSAGAGLGVKPESAEGPGPGAASLQQ